jgi:hypothetical protein
MLDRIRAAWSILRGTHKAIPVGASWYIGTAPSYMQSWPTTTSATNVHWTFPSA